MHEAERGVFELRRGRPVFVSSVDPDCPGSGALVLAVEGSTAAALESMRQLGGTPPRLIVTLHRARAMGLVNGEAGAEGAPSALALPLLSDHGPEHLLGMATALGRVDATDSLPACASEMAGLALARLGGLVPAVVSVLVETPTDELAARLARGDVMAIPSDRIAPPSEAPHLEVTPVSGAPVPLEHAQDARFLLFRESGAMQEHVAVLIGEPETWPDPVPVRLHSACLTGDLFGSLRCDCGDQLRGSLRVFASRGGGVLLYLAQEGRGIGLGNKLRAYALQQQGLDTVDADRVLGFGPDERRYEVAVAMLRELGIQRVELLTNNPEKLDALEHGGVTVVSRRPLHGTLNRHNLPYVEAKVRRAGHWLHEMLAGAGPTS